MLANRGVDTGPEVALRRELHRRGRRFRKHMRPLSDVRCTPDIVFTRARLAVFVDGCFWHCCPEHGSMPRSNGEWWANKLQTNVTRDRRNDAALIVAGWTVIRIWEHEAPTAAADRIEQALDGQRADRPEST
jgi:DNA mismatch endonuclease (patch repair protein)